MHAIGTIRRCIHHSYHHHRPKRSPLQDVGLRKCATFRRILDILYPLLVSSLLQNQITIPSSQKTFYAYPTFGEQWSPLKNSFLTSVINSLIDMTRPDQSSLFKYYVNTSSQGWIFKESKPMQKIFNECSNAFSV